MKGVHGIFIADRFFPDWKHACGIPINCSDNRGLDNGGYTVLGDGAGTYERLDNILQITN